MRVKSIGEVFLLSDHNALLKIIDEITLHAIDDLEEFLGIHGRQPLLFPSLILGRKKRFPYMIGVRKCLDISMVSNSDCGHSPLIRSFDQIFALGYAVHIAHFRMAVQLDSLKFCIINSLFDNRWNLHDSLQRGYRNLFIKRVEDRRALHLDPVPGFQRSEKFVGH